MRSALVLAAVLASSPAIAEDVIISVGADAIETVRSTMPDRSFTFMTDGEKAIVEIDASELDELSDLMHEKHQRCGGFMVHESMEEAQEPAVAERVMEYSIDRGPAVHAALPMLHAKHIEETIRELSAMKNRYYQSASGAAASIWLRDRWRSLTTRSDVTVELMDHGYEQKSVIMTIPGTTLANEVVVLGGHLDSIAPGGFSANAPGADDDASGVSTLTEVARVLLANDYRPARTIKFMAYAAEEVGLRGSLSIVREFKKQKVNVVGALQLDMTNYQGSDKDIWLIKDYTSAAQNAFLVSLIETYTTHSWGWDACGYACSDHASWHRAGVPASMPFEARFRDSNNAIHTNRDTLDRSNQNAEHAVKFARLATAYAIELGKGELVPVTKMSCKMSGRRPLDELFKDELRGHGVPMAPARGCGGAWKLFAALASLGLLIALWFRTSRVA